MKLLYLILVQTIAWSTPNKGREGRLRMDGVSLDQKLSEGHHDKIFMDDSVIGIYEDAYNFKRTDIGLNRGNAKITSNVQLNSECAVVVFIWKSLGGSTHLLPSSVSPIGCCDDQNSDIRGVKCSEDVAEVIGLEWSSWGKWNGKLAGHFPKEIGNLTHLRLLYLYSRLIFLGI